MSIVIASEAKQSSCAPAGALQMHLFWRASRALDCFVVAIAVLEERRRFARLCLLAMTDYLRTVYGADMVPSSLRTRTASSISFGPRPVSFSAVCTGEEPPQLNAIIAAAGS